MARSKSSDTDMPSEANLGTQSLETKAARVSRLANLDSGSDVTGGYITSRVGEEPRFRVPDLLTKNQFIEYMKNTYGVTVNFE